MFGGTANARARARHSGAEDDNLDWVFGWIGKVQFFVVQQGPTTATTASRRTTTRTLPTRSRGRPRNLERDDDWLGGRAKGCAAEAVRDGAAPGNGREDRQLHSCLLRRLPRRRGQQGGRKRGAGEGRLVGSRSSVLFANGTPDTAWASEADNDESFDEGAVFMEASRLNWAVAPDLMTRRTSARLTSSPRPARRV